MLFLYAHHYVLICIVHTPGLQVSADTIRNTSITLQWRTPNTPPGVTYTYYNISYTAVISFNTKKGDTVTYPVRKVMSATGSSYTVGPLNPSTTYTFTVTAYTTRNSTGPSDTITQRTDKGRTGSLFLVDHDNVCYVILNVENPSFMQIHFTEIDDCDIWQKVMCGAYNMSEGVTLLLI